MAAFNFDLRGKTRPVRLGCEAEEAASLLPCGFCGGSIWRRGGASHARLQSKKKKRPERRCCWGQFSLGAGRTRPPGTTTNRASLLSLTLVSWDVFNVTGAPQVLQCHQQTHKAEQTLSSMEKRQKPRYGSPPPHACENCAMRSGAHAMFSMKVLLRLQPSTLQDGTVFSSCRC